MLTKMENALGIAFHRHTFPYAGRYPFFCASAWGMYSPRLVFPY